MFKQLLYIERLSGVIASIDSGNVYICYSYDVVHRLLLD